MADEIIHFQWQNPYLRERIYPARMVKLRDFLMIYKEADLVQAHKSLPPEKMKARVESELAAYEQELQALIDKKDHLALLTRVVDYLENSGRGFEDWFKYMVIHFSGMRYRTAHGSYADPRQFLALLEIQRAKKERSNLLGIQAAALDSEIQKAIAEIQQNPAAATPPAQDRLVKLKDPILKRQALIDYRQALSTRRQAELKNMSDDQALAELEKLGPRGNRVLPGWLWAELVRRTLLRLKYVDENNALTWDAPTSQQQQERINSPAEWRQLFVDWLKSPGCDTTAWRNKNLTDLSLVVSSAVCNEVSEHVHHLRGQRPTAGLTARPKWYIDLEYRDDPTAIPAAVKPKSQVEKQHAKEQGKKQSNQQDADIIERILPLPAKTDASYIRRPGDRTFFKRGGSILWLRWVSPRPNPWQITHPLRDYHFLQGDGRDWKYNMNASGTQSTFERSKAISPPPSQMVPVHKPGEKEKKNQPVKLPKPGKAAGPAAYTQWLRWSHEAIVADMLELLDGWNVITFETFPVDAFDAPIHPSIHTPGLSLSASGVVRHPTSDLVVTPPANSNDKTRKNWYTFSAYTPPKDLDTPPSPGKAALPPRKPRLVAMLNRIAILAPEAQPRPIPVSFVLEGISGLEEDELSRRWDTLTKRQKQIAALYAQGYTIRQIATQLDTSPSNVSSLLSASRKKMGADNNAELASWLENYDFGDNSVDMDSSY